VKTTAETVVAASANSETARRRILPAIFMIKNLRWFGAVQLRSFMMQPLFMLSTLGRTRWLSIHNLTPDPGRHCWEIR
jgi:hypothetical protein